MAHKHKDNKSDCVSLDLFVGDEDDEPNSSQNVVETLCLRILSKSSVKYRFGGLQIHVRSPEFHIGKSFHVSLDEHNRIDSIESYREPEDNYLFSRRRVSLLGSNNLSTMPARILITPKKAPESDSNNNATSNLKENHSNKNNVLNNATVNVSAGKSNQVNYNSTMNKGQIPILTADVVVEEILDHDRSETQSQTSLVQSSLGASIVNTLLNKKSNNHTNHQVTNASSVGNSPSQSIHSIHSLSSSMLELRSASPISVSSPEKMISKLSLQAYGHTERESKYIKHKNKRFDFKKKSKEKLFKSDEKGEDKNAKKESNKSLENKNLTKNFTKNSDKNLNKNSDKTDKTIEIMKNGEKMKTGDDQNLIESVQNRQMKCGSSIEMKSVGVCAHLDASNLSLNIPQGFFSSLRRTRSWKK